MTARVRRVDLALAAVMALLFGAAPTVGDVGACGQTATALSEPAFASARKQVECQRCNACGIDTERCKSACNPSSVTDAPWPSTCEPLEHDGDVCLHALKAAGCSDIVSFMSDVSPTVPSECDFCRNAPRPSTPVGDL